MHLIDGVPLRISRANILQIQSGSKWVMTDSFSFTVTRIPKPWYEAAINTRQYQAAINTALQLYGSTVICLNSYNPLIYLIFTVASAYIFEV